MLYALTGATGVFTGAVDSAHIKAHRSAAGAKGGLIISILIRPRREVQGDC